MGAGLRGSAPLRRQYGHPRDYNAASAASQTVMIASGSGTAYDHNVYYGSNVKAPSVENGNLTRFEDADAVAGYAKISISLLVDAGVVQGDNGEIHPKDSLSRAEAAVLIYRLLFEK